MKVDLIRKFKWYIVGFILVAIMLSVSLSFCTWDTLSFKTVLTNNGSGNYELKWNDCIKGASGETLTSAPAVGSIVQYGNFYQASDAITTGATASQRWFVVEYDIDTKIATLLTEQVVVFGNFWGSVASHNKVINDYYRSTIRSWLNSGRNSVGNSGANDNVRNDGLNDGKPFGIDENQINKGFLDVAFPFGSFERTLLVPKTISNMQYCKQSVGTEPCITTTGQKSINDLVWLPSNQEIFGKSDAHGSIQMDSESSAPQFSYFSDNNNSKRISSATSYAVNAISSYYNNGNSSGQGGGAVWWHLRSPHPFDFFNSLHVNVLGASNRAAIYGPMGGVRPAVRVQL